MPVGFLRWWFLRRSPGGSSPPRSPKEARGLAAPVRQRGDRAPRSVVPAGELSCTRPGASWDTPRRSKSAASAVRRARATRRATSTRRAASASTSLSSRSRPLRRAARPSRTPTRPGAGRDRDRDCRVRSRLGAGRGEGSRERRCRGSRAQVAIDRDDELANAGLARPFVARAASGDSGDNRSAWLLEKALRGCLADLDGARPAWRQERVGLILGTSSGGMRAAERAFATLARASA